MQGDIVWYSDAASAVAITVTLTVDTEAQFNNTVIEFSDDAESKSVSLRIQNVNDCGSAHGWNANSVLTLIMAVLASLLISRWSGTSMWLILTGILIGMAALQACANNCTEKADVAILVPRYGLSYPDMIMYFHILQTSIEVCVWSSRLLCSNLIC